MEFYVAEKIERDNFGMEKILSTTPKMNLEQVDLIISCIQRDELHLWTITKYRQNKKVYNAREVLGRINAEEFVDDVPNFEE